MKRAQSFGFTLIEAIMVIVITGILVGMVAVFIARPVQGYIDSVRRAELTDVADLALKRMALDIRTAIPNSLRVDGTGRYLEYIPARAGGRYCTDSLADNDDTCNPLGFSIGGDSFSVLGPSVGVKTGDQVVIFNTGQNVALDVYGGSNRRPVNGASLGGMALTLSAAEQQADTITLGGATAFTYPSPSHRFQIIGALSAVTFACTSVGGVTTGTGKLRRHTGYGFFGTQTTTAANLGNGQLLAQNIAGCSFYYQPVNSANGLVSLSITLRREGESVTLSHQFHVDNMP